MGEFADDLAAFLGSHPIRARRGDRAYRARKLARRYLVPTALTAFAAVAVLSAGALVWYWSRPVSTLKDLKPERLTANTPELPIQAAAISPDGKSLAYSDPLGIHLRDMASGRTRLLPKRRHTDIYWWSGRLGGRTSPYFADECVEDAEGMRTMAVFPSTEAVRKQQILPRPIPGWFRRIGSFGRWLPLGTPTACLIQDSAGRKLPRALGSGGANNVLVVGSDGARTARQSRSSVHERECPLWK